MLNHTGKALFLGAATALAVTAAVPAAQAQSQGQGSGQVRAKAAAQVDRHQATPCARKKHGTCTYSATFFYWNKKGSGKRGLNYVQTSKSPYKAGKARWLYKKPGQRKARVGMDWRPARAVQHGQTAEVQWGKPNGTGGPKLPKGTLVCVQWKHDSKKACHTLK
ncbi:hypothetical protein [Streptomyces sp. NPDC059009]|uniref:hypothetical protein n=1 Tax=Streptomyces sp. NPDC059009 TaxID=3346694 RepID=UPI00369205A8